MKRVNSFAKSFFIGILPYLFSPLCLWGGIRIEGAISTKAEGDVKAGVQCYLVRGGGSSSTLFLEALSSSLSIRKYHTNLSDAEAVRGATFVNGSWRIENPELDCGYIVEREKNKFEYYWLANYETAPLPTLGIEVAPSPENRCEQLILSVPNLREWDYFSPNGTKCTIKRFCQIEFQDLFFDEESFSFQSKKKKESLRVKAGGGLTLLSPLCKTNFTLCGDQYSSIFEPDYKPLRSALYSPSRLEVYTRYTYDKKDGENSKEGNEPSLPAELSAPAKVKMEAVANAPIAQRYIWKVLPAIPKAENVAPLMVSNHATCEYTFDKAGRYTMQVEVASSYGNCLVESEKQILSISTSKLEIPNAFSPFSSPGVNDLFRVSYNSLVSFYGVIFNEWGNKLFEWRDPEEGWDGTYKGSPVAMGVYYYVIQATGADGKKYDRKGSITILGYDEFGKGSERDASF